MSLWGRACQDCRAPFFYSPHWVCGTGLAKTLGPSLLLPTLGLRNPQTCLWAVPGQHYRTTQDMWNRVVPRPWVSQYYCLPWVCGAGSAKILEPHKLLAMAGQDLGASHIIAHPGPVGWGGASWDPMAIFITISPGVWRAGPAKTLGLYYYQPWVCGAGLTKTLGPSQKVFLTPALDRHEWSVSSTDHFTHGTYLIRGWVDLTGCDGNEKSPQAPVRI
jgi:hypothetical protein